MGLCCVVLFICLSFLLSSTVFFCNHPLYHLFVIFIMGKQGTKLVNHETRMLHTFSFAHFFFFWDFYLDEYTVSASSSSGVIWLFFFFSSHVSLQSFFLLSLVAIVHHTHRPCYHTRIIATIPATTAHNDLYTIDHR